MEGGGGEAGGISKWPSSVELFVVCVKEVLSHGTKKIFAFNPESLNQNDLAWICEGVVIFAAGYGHKNSHFHKTDQSEIKYQNGSFKISLHKIIFFCFIFPFFNYALP